MSENSANIEVIANLLDKAERERVPIAPLSETSNAFTPQYAYAVQRALLKLKLARGGRLAGHKVGLTSLAMQQQLGVNEPDYGFLLDTMISQSESSFSLAKFIQPRIEPEIAFWLKHNVQGPGVTVEQVLQATGGVCAAMELIDSRITNWRIGLVDTIADNASSAHMVIGQPLRSPDTLDMSKESVTLLQNGKIVGTGNGAAVLGHPAAAVAWLANKLSEFGVGLQAEQWVLPGSMCSACSISRDDTFTAVFDTLGEVSASFH